ncbi:Ubiquitin-like-specific protease 2 [Trametes pubescens]|uniref:Ubiquitin-like-specific protease 2 n=1 Tax=Trametes pubescens TaxID=154538 RepID=A0A1M2VYX5_TRAPU|nr:Ubiquitin-like-specific protease 2 [Trametes pubescens]
MANNLNGTRASGGPSEYSANQTATRTVLNTGGGIRPTFRTTADSKRQKLEHTTSGYFTNGSAGTGKNKGKGKAVARAEPVEVPDSEEDVGQPVAREQLPGKHMEKEFTPDPIDLFQSDEARTSPPKQHAFERPSPKPKDRRLPPDGPATARLRGQRRGVEREVVDVDAPSEEDEIQSARFSDDGDVPLFNKIAATPNGRQDIPRGAVTNKIPMFDQKGPPSIPRPPKPRNGTIPTIDLKQSTTSRKAAMRPRNGNPTTISLARFNLTPVDAAATVSSGFKSDTGRLLQLPLQAMSLGCHLTVQDTENYEPTFWAHVQYKEPGKRYTLVIARGVVGVQPVAAFELDRDFDSFKYTEPDSGRENATVVVQFHSTTKSHHWNIPEYHPGAKHYGGRVTLKFLLKHANSNESAYSDLVDILKKQISKSEAMRGVASTKCWETVVAAGSLKSKELERHPPRELRASGSPAKPSPISTGLSHGSSSTKVRSEETPSVSAPPIRTYGERMVTRRAARETQKSETPENLDELVLVYPPSGTGAVNVTRGDLKRLDNGQYLNDTLIEFGLKVWLHELQRVQPELAEQVHVFNSFFFKKLNGKKDIKDTYPSVRKWTSKVDIFKKKYIIVPINENFHWYLAIIVNPENMLHPPPPQARRAAPQTRKRKREEQQPESATEAVPEEAAPEAVPEEVSSESRSDTAASEPVAATQPMAVDQESEGEGQEVETMLRFTQSCNIAEAVVEKKPEDRSRSATGDAIDLDDAELQYPASEEPMDVDPLPVPQKESKPPDTVEEESRKPSPSVDETTTTEEASTATERPETAAESKEDGDSSIDEESEPKPFIADHVSSEFPESYIYTFDSLGSRHSGPANKLSRYLQYEAADKKSYPIEDTCIAEYKRAKAPMQKNFCDCGLFVLAFVEAFMKDPVHSVERIQHNQIDWYTGSMENLREGFRERTIALSETWKKERAEKEGQKDEGASDKAKANAPAVEVIVDSDDDEIVVGEVIPAPKGANKRGKKAAENRAVRLRG